MEMSNGNRHLVREISEKSINFIGSMIWYEGKDRKKWWIFIRYLKDMGVHVSWFYVHLSYNLEFWFILYFYLNLKVFISNDNVNHGGRDNGGGDYDSHGSSGHHDDYVFEIF